MDLSIQRQQDYKADGCDIFLPSLFCAEERKTFDDSDIDWAAKKASPDLLACPISLRYYSEPYCIADRHWPLSDSLEGV